MRGNVVYDKMYVIVLNTYVQGQSIILIMLKMICIIFWAKTHSKLDRFLYMEIRVYLQHVFILITAVSGRNKNT